MRYTVEQRVFMYCAYIKHKSFVECRVKFIRKFPGVKVPKKSMVRGMVAKFHATGSLLTESEDEEVNSKHKPHTTAKQNKCEKKTGQTRASKRNLDRDAKSLSKLRNKQLLDSNTDNEEEEEPENFEFVKVKTEVEEEMETDEESQDKPGETSDSEVGERCNVPVKVEMDTEDSANESDSISDSDSADEKPDLSCVKQEKLDHRTNDQRVKKEKANEESTVPPVRIKQEAVDSKDCL